MHAFMERVAELVQSEGATRLVLITNDADAINNAANSFTCPKSIITNQRPSSSILMNKTIEFHHLSHSVLEGIDVLPQVKSLLISLCAQGSMERTDRIVCAVKTDIEAILTFNMEQLGISEIREEIEGRVPLEVIDNLMSLATSIVRGGKEGNPAGALFIIGDVARVMQISHQAIHNPFSSRPDAKYSVVEEEDIKTIREFALLDGAMIIEETGSIVAAGRYILVSKAGNGGIDFLEGFGGRHIAGAYVSKITNAISIVVSSSGTVRIFKDGREILLTEPR